MAYPILTVTTTTTTTTSKTPVISISNLPVSPASRASSFDPSQSSLSSASKGDDESKMEVFFANIGMMEGDEFDSSAFRAAYSVDLSPAQKQTYLAMLERAESGTGKKVSYKLVVEAGDFDEEEQKILKDAADMMVSIPKLKTLSEQYTKLAEKQLRNLENEDDDQDYAQDQAKIAKVYNKLPLAVRDEVEKCVKFYAPHSTCAVISKKDRHNWDGKKEIFLTTLGRAHVMQMLAKNNMLFVSDPVAREDIETMVRVIGLSIMATDAPFGLIEDYFSNAYANMKTTAAKLAYADIVGYAIGRPGDGEKYLTGKLLVDGKHVYPDISLLGRKLAELASHDGIVLDASFEVFFPKEVVEEEVEGDEGVGSNPGDAPAVENEAAAGSRAAMLNKWKMKLKKADE